MCKIILQEFVTLNGLAAGPNGSTDFIPAVVQGHQSFGQAQIWDHDFEMIFREIKTTQRGFLWAKASTSTAPL
jgi:hypothetical protein